MEYDFTLHVASDIGSDQLFLPPQNYRYQDNLNQIANWTKETLKQINVKKTNYMVFTRSHAKYQRQDRLYVYILLIRSLTEYCVAVWHSSLTVELTAMLERVQKTCLKVILGEEYTD